MTTSRLLGGALALTMFLLVGEVRGNMAPRPLARQPIAPTTQAHLEATRGKLEQALGALQKVQQGNPAPFGGFLEHAIADVMKAQADVAQAFLYLKAHPELNPLSVGEVPADAGRPLPDTLDFPPTPLTFPDLCLFQALDALMHRSGGSGRGPVLGDIGGYRAKIIEGIARARASLREGRKSAAALTSANQKAAGSVMGQFGWTPFAVPASPPTNASAPGVVFELLEVGDSTVIEIPRKRFVSAPADPPARAGGGSLLPTIVASTGLSLGLAFGGLHFFGRRKPSGAAVALLVGGTLALGVSAYANGPRPAPVKAVESLPGGLPLSALRQVTGPVTVRVVETGDSVRLLVPRHLARQLAALPPP